MKKFSGFLTVIIILLIVVCCVLAGCKNSETVTDTNLDAFYSEWMGSLKDDVKLKDIVIPGSHDSGTHGMRNYSETQGSRIDVQMQYGVRYFDLRVAKSKENLYFFHTFVNKSYNFTNFCNEAIDFIETHPTEFFIFDFQHFKNDSMNDVEEKIEEILKPDIYAVKNTENLADLTMGKIREKGYKYIIFWADEYSKPTKDYQFSRNTYLNSPYDKNINNQNAKNFVDDFKDYYDKATENMPIFVLQAQRTCNYAKLQFNIKKQEEKLNPVANKFFIKLYNNEELLDKTNIIMRDFITEDIYKIDLILRLNIPKNNFKEIPDILKNKEI